MGQYNHGRNDSKASEAELLQALPVSLKRSLLREMRSPLLNHNVIFASLKSCHARAHDLLVCELVLDARFEIGSMMFGAGENSEAMLFIEAGTCRYHDRRVALY